MDPVGAVFLATATGVGGGTMRDLLLGIAPVFWVRSPAYLVICVAAALLVFAGSRVVALSARPLVWADAVRLATFAVIGTEAASTAGTSMPIALLVGVITATGGGILRDLLCAQRPLILTGELYVTAALAGSLAYWLLHAAWGLGESAAAAVAAAATLALRGASILFGIELPKGRPAG